AFLVGMASNASRPAVQAMMADLVRPEDRIRAFSLNYWAINLGFAVSAMAAGFIAEYSYLAGFLLEAVMTMACAVVVFVKIPESRPVRSEGAAPEESVGLGTVLRDGRFMGVVGLSFLIALIFMQGSVGLPVAMGAAGFTPADYGMAIAVNGVLIVVLQIPVTRFIEHRDPGRLLVISSLLAGYGFGLTAFAGSVGVFALTVCVWTLAEIVNAPTQTGLVVRLSPLHGRGRYQGMYTMSWAVASLVAPLMSGFVIDRFGAEWLWGICAAIGTVAGLGYALLMRRVPGEGPAATAEGPGAAPEPGGDHAGPGGPGLRKPEVGAPLEAPARRCRPAGPRGPRRGTVVGLRPQPHWQGLPDWHPQPQPEPQPHAAIRVRFLISAGCSVSRSCVGSGVVPGVSAMGPSSRLVPVPIGCPSGRAHQRRTEAHARPVGTGEPPPRPFHARQDTHVPRPGASHVRRRAPPSGPLHPRCRLDLRLEVGLDLVRVLARDQVDDPLGDRDRVVGEALVVAAEQGDVDGRLDAVLPAVVHQVLEERA